MNERLQIISKSITDAGLVNEVTTDEVVDILNTLDIPVRDYDKLTRTIVYIRKRFIEKMGRARAFQIAFPERCIPNKDAKVPFPNTKEDLSKTAIEIKAKRLENSQIYIKVVGLMQTSLYVAYAIPRIQVLDRLLDRCMSDDISDRDLGSLSKTFLEETRKPEEAKGMELNVNFGDDSTMKSIEEKLSDVAKLMEGKSADEIIEVLAIEDKE